MTRRAHSLNCPCTAPLDCVCAEGCDCRPHSIDYVLPSGRRVPLSADATKGAARTSFTLSPGVVVDAVRADLAAVRS